MKYATLRHRLKNSLLVPIGLIWIVLLTVPAAVQIVQDKEVTTID